MVFDIEDYFDNIFFLFSYKYCKNKGELQSYRGWQHYYIFFYGYNEKENYGYRQLFGRVVKNTLIKKVDGFCTSYMITKGLEESVNANM
ncbi:hypothetical protein HanLR1_Chr03g0082171 [Helianthus annuus]|nr:hypothetical protein HanHA89_Chr03g0088991 [Helianthus annuus]KAJ0766837.1 hypothetical protein HanLR1_Chr03g0082171 [Helianthus annuus]